MTSQNNLKPNVPVCECSCSREAQLCRNDNQMASSWPSIWETIAPVGTAVISYPVQQETDIQPDPIADGTRRMDNSSQIYREPQLNNASLLNSQQSFESAFHPQFNIRRQPELNFFNDFFSTNYNASMRPPFPVSPTNLLERVTNEAHPVYQQSSLSHDQLHNNFLNRELFHFDTDLLESDEVQTSYTDSSDNFSVCLGRELEQWNEEVSQLSSINVEENTINPYHFSTSDVYIDGSNQTDDVLLEQSNHSVELQSHFYEKSVEPDKIIEKYKILEERGHDPMKQYNKNEQSFCGTSIMHTNRSFSPDERTSTEESRPLRLVIGAKIENNRLGVIEDVTCENVMNQIYDKNNSQLDAESVSYNNLEEALFYEAKMNEIDVIDSALSSAEQNMKINSNRYDLCIADVKNIGTLEHLEYSKGGTRSFIPRTMEMTVMPFTIHLGDSPPPTENEEPEESSQAHGSEEELDGSNRSEPSTFEMGSSQETSSQYKIENYQMPDEAATGTKASSDEYVLAQIQQTGPSSTCAHVPLGDNVKEKSPEDESRGGNLISEPDYFDKMQKMASDNENVQVVCKNDTDRVDESVISSNAGEEERSDSILQESIDINIIQSTIGLEHLFFPESKVPEKIEIPHSCRNYPESCFFKFSSGISIVKTDSKCENENDQTSKEIISTEILSTLLSSHTQMQKALSSSTTQGDHTPEKGSEDEHRGVSVESSEPNCLDERQTLTPDNKTNKIVYKNISNIVAESNRIVISKQTQNQELEMKTNEKTDVAVPLKEKNIETHSNADELNTSVSTQNIDTKIKDNDGRTESVRQQTMSRTELPETNLQEQQLPFATKMQAISDIQNPVEDLPEPLTSETSTKLEMNSSRKTGSHIEKNINNSTMEGTATEVLSFEPLPTQSIQEATVIAYNFNGTTDIIPVKLSKEEQESVSSRTSGPDYSGNSQAPDIETNQVDNKNDSIAISEPICDKTEENLCQESMIKENEEEMNEALPLEAKIPQTGNVYNLSTSSNKGSIETNIIHLEDGHDSVKSETVGMTAVPSTTITEHHLPCEIKTEESLEIQNPAGELLILNMSKSSTVLNTNPLAKIGSTGERKIDQPPEGGFTEMSPKKQSSMIQTPNILVSDDLSVEEITHDNIEIQISPSELAWLNEPETKTEIGSQPCFEQLGSDQLEQVPPSIEGMLQITMTGSHLNQERIEESAQIITEKEERTVAEASCLLEVSEMVEKNTTPDRSAISETKHVSREPVPDLITSEAPLYQSSSMDSSADEPVAVTFESKPSGSVVESNSVSLLQLVPSCSGPTSLVKQEDKSIAHDPSDRNQECIEESAQISDVDAPLAKRKRTGSIKSMKLRVKETRKSSRVKKYPDRLFYIGKGQLF